MKEIEVKFLDIDDKALISKLRRIGAEKTLDGMVKK